eukprot:13725335-Alexandrium_andersonii.AAC.1
MGPKASNVALIHAGPLSSCLRIEKAGVSCNGAILEPEHSEANRGLIAQQTKGLRRPFVALERIPEGLAIGRPICIGPGSGK